MPDVPDRSGCDKLPRLLQRSHVRYVRLTIATKRASEAAFIISSASAKFVASGFSQKTCRPTRATSKVVA
jgi:hypothetical protein